MCLNVKILYMYEDTDIEFSPPESDKLKPNQNKIKDLNVFL